ncbi:hypothetical protein Taro_000285, partial [Colocasia esculenta]|nr:hypothetical protein [Colocasia esculenta]
MVCGARLGSSSRRCSRGRGLLAASGLGEFTPPHPRVPGSGQSTPSPPPVAGPSVSAPLAFLAGTSTVPEAEDAVRMLLVYRRGEAVFIKALCERKNAEKVCHSADSTLWRERTPTWMRRDYWESLCNIWATERWQQTSITMKVNRVANLEANMHTSRSVSFATHQSRLEKELKRPLTFQEVFDKTHKKTGTDQYISDRAREVAMSIYKESYSQQMIEKYAKEEQP